ncbi:MAG TPA: EcsC family protein [Lacipirellulaceae bacterium]|nr:EcsC family protein [Lacipirellulaceae bacterium]
MAIDPTDLQALIDAVRLLESPGLAVQIAEIIGKPIEYGVSHLPDAVVRRIGDTTNAALRIALRTAIATMNGECGVAPSQITHKLLATLSGAVGGAFGLPALAVELPVSTTIILRSIADIARGQGENIRDVDTQLACVEVFALGGDSAGEGVADAGYYATRAALAHAVANAAQYIAQKGLVEENAPVIVRLITKIAARFSGPVLDKFVAQSIPVVGAAGGAAVNLVFINHFQDMARGHFTIRRLERKYGEEVVRQEYENSQRAILPRSIPTTSPKAELE